MKLQGKKFDWVVFMWMLISSKQDENDEEESLIENENSVLISR